jgi:hypothetical protein
MDSDRNRFDNSLKRLREWTPPPDVAANLERKVMRRLLNSRPQHQRLLLRWATVSGALSLLLMMTVLVIRHESATPSLSRKSAFEESVVILDDGLVCIWLEPLDNSLRVTAP